MIILVIKEPDIECSCADQISKEYPDSSIIRYKQYSDQELLAAIDGPALIVLNHKMAIPHAKLLQAASSELLVRIMVILEEGFAMHAVNARIAGAHSCLSMPFEPAILIQAIENEGSTLRRMAEAAELIKSQACINRRYTLIRMLGASRHGVVFLALDNKANTQITIKLLRKSLSASAEFMEEFRDLAEKYKQITAPSVVPLFDYGSWNGYAYMAMNLGKAENLYEIMGKRKLQAPEIARIGLAVTRALIAIKKQGVIHFDIKPENILCYKEQYFLAEFGSMLPFDRPDGAGYYYWPDSAYTSPESFVEDASFSIRSDVYSLGLTLYVLARRENPFAGRPCTWELNSRVSKNMVNFLEDNPLEEHPPLAITIEAMTLCRHNSRPRLRDLEIIFYQLVLMLSSKSNADAPGVSALQTSRATTISKAAADSEASQTIAIKTNELKRAGKKSQLDDSSPLSISSLLKKLSLKTRVQLAFLVLLLLFSLVQAGRWSGRRGLVRKHFQQGPLQVFTCYNGHTATLRTLDLRNARCPQCNAETSPSYTCNKCKEVFGLIPWPRRDMSEKECAEFEEKLSKCPFCKSTDIAPTEKTTVKKTERGPD